MENFRSFSGVVTMINDFGGGNNQTGCYHLITIDNGQGMLVNFVVEPETYVVEHMMIRVGDRVTGFYDANVPVPLIYPPQYRAVVMTVDLPDRYVTVDYFNEQLESSDGMLRLNISPQTAILLENGQRFTGNIANRNLIVSYGATTKSIPAQTVPYEIVVMC